MHTVLKTAGLMGSPRSQKPRCSSSFQLHSREQQLRLIRDCPSRPRRRSSLVSGFVHRQGSKRLIASQRSTDLRRRNSRSSPLAAAGSSEALRCPVLMDLWPVPTSREPGWYLALIAPNIKGPNYPWLDPSRLYCHRQGLQDCIADLLQPFCEDPIDLVAGIDAMGFILGAAIANTLQKGFLAIRKAGHLCVETCTQPYTDYTARQKLLEMRTDTIQPGLRVLLVDQWIETGGTMRAAIQLVEQQGGVIAGIAAICIEDSDGGKWIQEHYKCSQCVPQHLMPQFNRHQLESFQAFGATPGQA